MFLRQRMALSHITLRNASSRRSSTSSGTNVSSNAPLSHIRVLELGTSVAAPFAGSLLSFFGADVIKIEPPSLPDPVRRWRVMDGDDSLWFRSLGRNKRCVSVDIRTDVGAALVRRMLTSADVLLENFSPGYMERIGFGPDDVRAVNGDLIYTRISGYGQTGPMSQTPGYASTCEAYAGWRSVVGTLEGEMVRPNLSMGDSITGLHAAFGTVMALLARDRAAGSDRGQIVDVSIVESVLQTMEACASEWLEAGAVRKPAGTAIPGVVPSNTYRAADGQLVVIGANSDSLYQKLMHAIGRSDLATRADLATNDLRSEPANTELIDSCIAQFIGERPASESVEYLMAKSVPISPINSIDKVCESEHLHARGFIERVTRQPPRRRADGGHDRDMSDEQQHVQLQTMYPKLSRTPGATTHAGVAHGFHTDEVLRSLCELGDAELERLEHDGIIKRTA